LWYRQTCVGRILLRYRGVYLSLYMRPRVDIDDDTRCRVREYATEKGFTIPRAYAELLHIGLKQADVEVEA